MGIVRGSANKSELWKQSFVVTFRIPADAFPLPVQIGGEMIELEFLNGLFHQQGSNPNLQMILFQYPEIKYQDDF